MIANSCHVSRGIGVRKKHVHDSVWETGQTAADAVYDFLFKQDGITEFSIFTFRKQPDFRKLFGYLKSGCLQNVNKFGIENYAFSYFNPELYFSMFIHAVVLLCINQHTRFELRSFTNSKDMTGTKSKNGARDSDHAH